MESEVRSALEAVYMPPVDVVVIGADNADPSPEHLAIYRQWCDDTLKVKLQAVNARNEEIAAGWDEERDLRPLPDNYKRPMVRTHYPFDDFESEDVVGLDANGNIEIIDEGSR